MLLPACLCIFWNGSAVLTVGWGAAGLGHLHHFLLSAFLDSGKSCLLSFTTCFWRWRRCCLCLPASCCLLTPASGLFLLELEVFSCLLWIYLHCNLPAPACLSGISCLPGGWRWAACIPAFHFLLPPCSLSPAPLLSCYMEILLLLLPGVSITNNICLSALFYSLIQQLM